jgi:hypothetical protein
LLTLTNFTGTDENLSTGRIHSTTTEDSDSIEIPDLTAPKVCLPLQNVQAYMAGYVIRRSELAKCSQCKIQCTYEKPPENDLYAFLAEKTNAGSYALCYPTEPFVGLVEQWEKIFNDNIDNVIHTQGVLGRLFRCAEPSNSGFLNCGIAECEVKLHAMLTLYMKVRLHAVLKRANKAMSKTKSGKRNGKRMKLQNL